MNRIEQIRARLPKRKPTDKNCTMPVWEADIRWLLYRVEKLERVREAAKSHDCNTLIVEIVDKKYLADGITPAMLAKAICSICKSIAECEE